MTILELAEGLGVETWVVFGELACITSQIDDPALRDVALRFASRLDSLADPDSTSVPLALQIALSDSVKRRMADAIVRAMLAEGAKR